MKVPSGREFSSLDLEIVQLMHQQQTVKWDEKGFRLKSGVMSNVYVYARNDLTECPSFLNKIGTKLCQVLKASRQPQDKQHCVIGIPTAGTAPAIAAAMKSDAGEPVACRIMREETKKHGTNNRYIDGDFNSDKHTYRLIDNVVTDGKTKIEDVPRWLRDSGYPPPKELSTIILVDRQQGGVENMRAAGFERIEVVYYLLDIVYAFGQLSLWMPEQIKAVQDEIAVHQFKP